MATTPHNPNDVYGAETRFSKESTSPRTWGLLAIAALIVLAAIFYFAGGQTPQSPTTSTGTATTEQPAAPAQPSTGTETQPAQPPASNTQQ